MFGFIWKRIDGLVLNCSNSIANALELLQSCNKPLIYNIYPIKYAYGFVVLCFVLVAVLVFVDTCDTFTHILQGCFTGTGVIIWLPQCQCSNHEGRVWHQPVTNHNKTLQSKTRGHISWDILYFFQRQSILKSEMTYLWIQCEPDISRWGPSNGTTI